jgi:hypothetical protein
MAFGFVGPPEVKNKQGPSPLGDSGGGGQQFALPSLPGQVQSPGSVLDMLGRGPAPPQFIGPPQIAPPPRPIGPPAIAPGPGFIGPPEVSPKTDGGLAEQPQAKPPGGGFIGPPEVQPPQGGFVGPPAIQPGPGFIGPPLGGPPGGGFIGPPQGGGLEGLLAGLFGLGGQGPSPFGQVQSPFGQTGPPQVEGGFQQQPTGINPMQLMGLLPLLFGGR